MSEHFIFDFETFGQDRLKCVLVDCSACVFDWDRFSSSDPYSAEELLEKHIKKFKFDVKDQIDNHGYKTEKKTLEWWQQQSKEAQKMCLPSSEDKPIKMFPDFLKYILDGKKIDKWWARGPDFDGIILRRVLHDLGEIKEIYDILKFWNVRDTRSFIDGFTLFGHKNDFIPMEDEKEWEKIFVKHDSRHDIMADVLRLQTLVRMRADLI